MATKAEKAAYNDYIKEYKAQIDDCYKKVKELEAKKKKMPNIQGYVNLEMILEFLKTIFLYINMSDASLEMMNVKNEKFLDTARKEFYKVLQLMEDTVGKEADRSLKENEDYLKMIDRVTPLQLLRFIQRLHLTIKTIFERLGESSKWRWSFVEIQARVAVITKNIINFSDIQRYRDPRSPFYKERQELLQICRKSLEDAAQQYRVKYENSTKVPEDMLRSIELLTVLRRIHILFGDSDEATKLKNRIEALRGNLEKVEKDKEEEKKKKR